MLTNIFKNPLKAGLFTLLLTGGAFWFHLVHTPYAPDMYAVVGFLLFLVLTAVNMHLLYRNTGGTSPYYPLFWALLAWSFPSVMTDIRISLSYLAVSFMSMKVFALSQEKKRLLNLFDAGLLLGIAVFLYPGSLVMIIWIYAGYAYFYGIIDKHLFMPLAGLANGLILLYTGSLLTGNTADFSAVWQWEVYFPLPGNAVPWMLWGAWIVPGILYFLFRIGQQTLRDKKVYKSMLWLFTTAMMMIIFHPPGTFPVLYTFLPVAYFTGETAGKVRKKSLLEAGLLVWILLVIWIRVSIVNGLFP